MSDSTSELSLSLAVDSDDTADYLVLALRQSLQTLDSLFNQVAGHTHSGPHQGGQITASGLTGPLDVSTWFRSRTYGSAPPSSGVGLDWFWDPPNGRGLIESYDHDAGAQKGLRLLGSELALTLGDGDKAFEFGAGRNIHVWNSDGSGAFSFRARAGNGLEVVNSAYSSVTFWIDDTGNVGVADALYVGGQTVFEADVHFNSHNADGIGLLTFASGANLHASADRVQATNHLDVGFDLNVGRTLTVTGGASVSGAISGASVASQGTIGGTDVNASGHVAAGAFVGGQAGDLSANRGGGQGFLYLGDSNHRLEYNASNYVLRNAGLSTDWLATNTGGRNSSYGLTLPNNSGQAGRGIAYAWDTYSAAAGKQNIRPITDALVIVSHPDLHGVTYQAKGGGSEQVGFVADPWLSVLPSVVSTDDQGAPLAMDYARVGAITFEALKELVARVQRLEQQERA